MAGFGTSLAPRTRARDSAQASVPSSREDDRVTTDVGKLATDLEGRRATVPSAWLPACVRAGVDTVGVTDHNRRAVLPLDATTATVNASLGAVHDAGARGASDIVVASREVGVQICAVMGGGREALETRSLRIMGGARDQADPSA